MSFRFQVPLDSIQSIMSLYPVAEETTENITMAYPPPSTASSSIREYLCYSQYLEAQESFADWFSRFHHGKPQPLGELPKHATFTEKVAYDHKKAQHNAELERWRQSMDNHTQVRTFALF